MAITAIYDYHFPLGATTYQNFDAYLDGTSILFEKSDYKQQNPDSRYWLGTLEYQALPFANFAFGCSIRSWRNGWSTKTGRKLRIEEARILNVLGSYEIIVTPNLWISQAVNLPAAGKNRRAPLLIQTNLRYNFFLQ